jgi:hypothetical protein
VSAPASLGVFRMPFGKHRGTAITEVPGGYLAWLADAERLSTWHAPTRAAIELEVERRAAAVTPTTAPPPPTPTQSSPRAVEIDAEMLIAAGAAELGQKYPDAKTAITLIAAELRAGLVAF